MLFETGMEGRFDTLSTSGFTFSWLVVSPFSHGPVCPNILTWKKA